MSKFRTPWNIGSFPKSPGIVNDKPSLTIPDRSLTIPQLLVRYASGVPLGISQLTPIWRGEDNDYPDPAKMDISERVEFARYLDSELKTMKEAALKRQADYRAKKMQEAQLREEAMYRRFIEKRTAEQSDSTNNT